MKMIKKLVLYFLSLCLLLPIINSSTAVYAAYPTSFTYEAENMLSEIGHPEYYSEYPAMTSIKATVTNDSAGYLVYGPYSTSQLAGKNYRVSYKIKAQGSTSLPIARLEVYNTGREILSDWDLYMSNFSNPGEFESFSLDFSRNDDIGVMEYRVWFYDNADLEIDKISVQEITNQVDSIHYQSESLRRNIGHVVDEVDASNGKVVTCLASEGAGYMQYGPYTLYQEPNNTYRATYQLKVTDNTSSNIIARIDASNAHGNGEWNYLDIKGTDFSAPNTYQQFYVTFNRIQEGTMEYRIYSYGVTDITSDYVKVEKITQSTNGYESENLFSSIGSIINDDDASGGQARQALSSDNGYLQYGPYTIDQPSGNSYNAAFRMKVNNNWQNVPIVRIEARNNNGSGQWRYKIIKSNDFSRVDTYEDFSLDFTRTNDGSMEYRVYVYGNSNGVNVSVDKVDVYKKNDSNWVYESESSNSSVGVISMDSSASNGKAREATTANQSSGYLVYGPYTDDQPINQVYTAIFKLKTRNNSRIENIARIEVNNPGGNSQFVTKDIRGIDFYQNNTWQDFSVNFLRRPGGNLEFRVYFYDISDLLSDNVTVLKFSNDEVVYQAEEQLRSVGSVMNDATADSGKTVITYQGSGQGYMSYGPYTLDQSLGNYEVAFRLKRGVATNMDMPMVRIEAYNNNGSGSLVWKNITARSLSSEYSDQKIYFTRGGEGNMEYRVYFYDNADVMLDKITVTKI